MPWNDSCTVQMEPESSLQLNIGLKRNDTEDDQKNYIISPEPRSGRVTNYHARYAPCTLNHVSPSY